MIYYGRPTRFASGIEDIIASTVTNLVPPNFVTERVQLMSPDPEPQSGGVKR
jgi:hypothetical protein